MYIRASSSLRLAAILLLGLTLALNALAQTPRHRATHLGNPATRFADPLKTPEDLRRTLLDERLREDVQRVLRLSGYTGEMEDFRAAAANAPIEAVRIPVGTVLPAMSTRRKGQVHLLRDVLWAGKQPIDAYAFSFISGDRRWRIVAPKACSNFWAEEALPRPRHALALSCQAPASAPQPYILTHCCTLQNTGDYAEAPARLSMAMPEGAKVRCVSGGADVSDARRLSWRFDPFPPGARRTVCATFAPDGAGRIQFRSTASSALVGEQVQTVETLVTASPEELLEVVGPGQAVKSGEEVAHLIRVHNLGAEALSQLQLRIRLGEGLVHVAATGPSPVAAAEGGLTATLPVLNAGEQAEWRVVSRVQRPGEIRVEAELVTEQFFCPVQKAQTFAAQ